MSNPGCPVGTKGPRIGIWWLVAGRIVRLSVAPSQVTCRDGICDAPLDHVRVWPRLVGACATLRGLEYDRLPRGRVIKRGGTFVILLGLKESQDASLINQITEAFDLQSVPVLIETDEHYETLQRGRSAAFRL